MFWRGKKRPKKDAPATARAAGAGEGALGAGDADASSGVSTTQFLTGDSDLDRRSVEVLLEAIAAVSQSRDLEQLLIDIVDRSIEITGAERGLLLLQEPSGELLVRVGREGGGQPLREDDVRFSTSVVRKVLEEDQPVRATVQSDSDALELGRSVFDLKLRAVMCVPLVGPAPVGDGASSAARGALYVDSRAATRSFGQRDLSLFAALSHHISTALENARLNLLSLEKVKLEQSLELASAIQSGLMPDIPRGVQGFDVHGWYKAAEQSSGDFFDFVRTRAKDLAVVLGDVTGHGIGPALIGASAQASLRSYLRVVSGPGEALTLLNQDLAERTDDGMFVTVLVMVLREGGRCEVANAGHATPLLWRARSGDFEPVTEHSVALGMLDEVDFGVDRELQLEPGDVLLGYTDGLIEAHPAGTGDVAEEHLFGEARVREVLAAAAARGASAEELVRALSEAVLAFAGGAVQDDITLVVARKT